MKFMFETIVKKFLLQSLVILPRINQLLFAKNKKEVKHRFGWDKSLKLAVLRGLQKCKFTLGDNLHKKKTTKQKLFYVKRDH